MPMLDVYVKAHDAAGLAYACLQKACVDNASDVHVEPIAQGWHIRQRVDGLLMPVINLPLSLGQAFVVRIKLLADLDIGESRIPHDGSFQQSILGQNLDIRCNVLPGYLGEKIVLRIQNSSQKLLGLQDLGMSPSQYQTLTQQLVTPQGMVMVTGPTGAGKSITLYASLQYLLAPTRNVMSVEDPVEIVMSGIHQVGLVPQKGIDFSQVLRALLRQDPDVIMLGELRDNVSADMAIKAAQTGHLLLTSMHTNTALEAVNRCYGLGVDLIGLSYCLQLVINQRLVRKLCIHCKQREPENRQAMYQSALWKEAANRCRDENIQIQPSVSRGCKRCFGGYKGRIGVFEFWQVQDHHREFIREGVIPSELNANCLRFEAMVQVLAGQTTVNELTRVFA